MIAIAEADNLFAVVFPLQVRDFFPHTLSYRTSRNGVALFSQFHCSQPWLDLDGIERRKILSTSIYTRKYLLLPGLESQRG